MVDQGSPFDSSQVSSPTSISSVAQACLEYFETICDELQNVTPEDSGRNGYNRNLVLLAMQDGRVRFKAWGTNIAAFRDGRLPTSLDFRLKDAPEIRSRLLKVLEYLQEYLDDAFQIIRGEKPNQTWKDGMTSDSDSEEELEKQADGVTSDVATETSELEELSTAIGSSNGSLMKLSMLIRDSSNRDDYLKAASRYNTWDPNPYIGHVREKYGSAKGNSDWLVERLGKSTLRRRQFLRYREEHHGKLTGDWGELLNEDTEEKSPENTKPAKTVASTKATTFVVGNASKNDGSDFGGSFGSQTSYEPTEFEGDSVPTKLTVPPPPKWAFENVPFKYGEPFQCPYCYIEQEVKNKAAWKKHVFRDLKPYVCTFAGCGMRMFRSRNEWFAHELQYHRREWVCQYCQHKAFASASTYSNHLASSHTRILESTQVEALLLQSEEPVDKIASTACPLCDEWESNLNHSKQDAKKLLLNNGKAVEPYGTPKQFRRHLGRHMEQLALFALPIRERGGLEDDSSEDDESEEKSEKLQTNLVSDDKEITHSSAIDKVSEGEISATSDRDESSRRLESDEIQMSDAKIKARIVEEYRKYLDIDNLQTFLSEFDLTRSEDFGEVRRILGAINPSGLIKENPEREDSLMSLATPGEDWTKNDDPAERQRIQNRVAQRRYRTELKTRLEKLEERAGSSSTLPTHTPTAVQQTDFDISESLTTSGSGPRMRRLSVSTGHHGGASMNFANPPGSSLLEAYHGTYQSISPMPSQLITTSHSHSDVDLTEPLSPAGFSSDEDREDSGKKGRPTAHFHDPNEEATSPAKALRGENESLQTLNAKYKTAQDTQPIERSFVISPRDVMQKRAARDARKREEQETKDAIDREGGIGRTSPARTPYAPEVPGTITSSYDPVAAAYQAGKIAADADRAERENYANSDEDDNQNMDRTRSLSRSLERGKGKRPVYHLSDDDDVEDESRIVFDRRGRSPPSPLIHPPPGASSHYKYESDEDIETLKGRQRRHHAPERAIRSERRSPSRLRDDYRAAEGGMDGELQKVRWEALKLEAEREAEKKRLKEELELNRLKESRAIAMMEKAEREKSETAEEYQERQAEKTSVEQLEKEDLEKDHIKPLGQDLRKSGSDEEAISAISKRKPLLDPNRSM